MFPRRTENAPIAQFDEIVVRTNLVNGTEYMMFGLYQDKKNVNVNFAENPSSSRKSASYSAALLKP